MDPTREEFDVLRIQAEQLVDAVDTAVTSGTPLDAEELSHVNEVVGQFIALAEAAGSAEDLRLADSLAERVILDEVELAQGSNEKVALRAKLALLQPPNTLIHTAVLKECRSNALERVGLLAEASSEDKSVATPSAQASGIQQQLKKLEFKENLSKVDERIGHLEAVLEAGDPVSLKELLEVAAVIHGLHDLATEPGEEKATDDQLKSTIHILKGFIDGPDEKMSLRAKIVLEELARPGSYGRTCPPGGSPAATTSVLYVAYGFETEVRDELVSSLIESGVWTEDVPDPDALYDSDDSDDFGGYIVATYSAPAVSPLPEELRGLEQAALAEAVQFRDAAALETLVATCEAGLVDEVGPGGYTPLTLAAYYGFGDVIAALAGCGADPDGVDANDYCPIALAARMARPEAVAAMIAVGASVHTLNSHGRPPLSMIISSDDYNYPDSTAGVEIGRQLLEAGASASDAWLNGRFPLTEASTSGDGAIVELLVEYGADPNKRDEYGQTPLSRAAAAGVMEGDRCPALEALLSSGADPSAADYPSGNTPLMLAANPEIAERLLEGGADPTAINREWEGPSDMRSTDFGRQLPLRVVVGKQASLFQRLAWQGLDGIRYVAPESLADQLDSLPVSNAIKEAVKEATLAYDPAQLKSGGAAEVISTAPTAVDFQDFNRLLEEACFSDAERGPGGELVDPELRDLEDGMAGLVGHLQDRDPWLGTPPEDDVDGVNAFYDELNAYSAHVLDALGKMEPERDDSGAVVSDDRAPILRELATGGHACAARWMAEMKAAASIVCNFESNQDLPSLAAAAVHSDVVRTVDQLSTRTANDVHTVNQLLYAAGISSREDALPPDYLDGEAELDAARKTISEVSKPVSAVIGLLSRNAEAREMFITWLGENMPEEFTPHAEVKAIIEEGDGGLTRLEESIENLPTAAREVARSPDFEKVTSAQLRSFLTRIIPELELSDRENPSDSEFRGALDTMGDYRLAKEFDSRVVNWMKREAENRGVDPSIFTSAFLGVVSSKHSWATCAGAIAKEIVVQQSENFEPAKLREYKKSADYDNVKELAKELAPQLKQLERMRSILAGKETSCAAVSAAMERKGVGEAIVSMVEGDLVGAGIVMAPHHKTFAQAAEEVRHDKWNSLSIETGEDGIQRPTFEAVAYYLVQSGLVTAESAAKYQSQFPFSWIGAGDR